MVYRLRTHECLRLISRRVRSFWISSTRYSSYEKLISVLLLSHISQLDCAAFFTISSRVDNFLCYFFCHHYFGILLARGSGALLLCCRQLRFALRSRVQEEKKSSEREERKNEEKKKKENSRKESRRQHD